MKDTNFREQLKALLKQKGTTQGELADMLGVSQAAVSQFTNPALSTVQDVCKALGVDFIVTSAGHIYFTSGTQ